MRGRKEESSFFEKKEAKKLFSHGAARFGGPASIDTVFLLLFVHKKKTLPAPCLSRLGAARA
jgi:hypothetical protein